MQVPHGLPSVEGGEEWAEIRVERKQRRRVCMYESFMIGKQETESVVKYSTAGLRNSEIADETRVRWFLYTFSDTESVVDRCLLPDKQERNLQHQFKSGPAHACKSARYHSGLKIIISCKMR